MRRKKALINILFALILEVITVISGFIVPRLIIKTFGSDVNGLANSITSFIGYISVLQLGVGSVIKASLYRPLANKDKNALDIIVKSASKFYGKIGFVSIAYILVLSVIFPLFLAPEFGTFYTGSLVLIIGISTIFTYLFGITYQMLLEADQRSYIYSIVQIVTVILNTIIVVVLVKFNASIHVVKFGSAMLFVLRPIVLSLYCKRYYRLDLTVQPSNEVIAQRWDGFAQGLAYYIHSKTDIFVLTIFSNYISVSVYSVYALITTGLNSVITSIDRAVRSAFGNIIAKEEYDHLKSTFDTYNCAFHLLTTVVFSTASITVFRFIDVYVGSIDDGIYYQPLFGILIITAEYLYCLRLPYYSIIYAAGKFKETKKSAWIEAVVNIVFSIILVNRYGLIGVAIGTLVAMMYRNISFGIFLHNNILELTYIKQIRRYLISFLTYSASIILFTQYHIKVSNYAEWGIYTIVVCFVVSVTSIALFSIFDFKAMKSVYKYYIRNLIKKSYNNGH